MKFLRKKIKSLIYRLFCFFEKTKWDVNYENYRKKYSISDSFRFNGFGIVFYGDGKIEIGCNTYMGENSCIQASKDCSVKIGDNCFISHFVRIYTSNYNSIDIIKNNKDIGQKFGNVIIGNNCWIGSGVFIKEGVSIGNNVVIGANSVVVKDIPSNTIVSGIPAIIIKSLNC